MNTHSVRGLMTAVPRLAAGLLVLGLTLAVLAGCTVETDDGPVAVTDEVNPTSRQLIAQAVERGEIDEPTSLLYRIWLFYEDSQLPEQYIGEPEAYEHGLITEVRERLDEIPAEIRAQIEPYLLRPADPGSVFNAQPSGSQTDVSSYNDPKPNQHAVNTSVFHGADITTADKKVPARPCRDGWISTAVTEINFRVWACVDEDAQVKRSAQESINFAADILREYVPKMSADMGELIPDDPNMQSHLPPDQRSEEIDELIDVYVLPTGWKGPYRANHTDVPNFARTVETWPEEGVKTSSYILVSLDHFDDLPLVKRLIVHELFHAYQNTHNAKLESPWYGEGSAEWAASYYVREDSARLHAARLPLVQDTVAPSILLVDGLAPYGAYIWPLFMEQEEGPQAIFNSWKNLGSLPAEADDNQVIRVLSAELDVAKRYPDLAMRLVNTQLNGDPISPRFHDLDGNFPDGRMPLTTAATLANEPIELSGSLMYGLGYRDFRIKVVPPDNHPPKTGVMVRISGKVATEAGVPVTLEGLVRDVDGDYSRVKINYSGDGDHVCVDEDMILVLSNTSITKMDLTKGNLTLTRLDGEPCSRVEVNHPEFFHQLSEGELVQIDGTEGDDIAEKTQLAITVRDLDPTAIDEYAVKVTVTGDTLNSPRTFNWRLTEFDDVGMNQWRKVVPLPLDHDLTSQNRPLTINAILTRLDNEVDSHAPTVELHADLVTECTFDINWSGPWTQTNPDAEFFPGPQQHGPMSGETPTQPDEAPLTGRTSGIDSQSGSLPLVLRTEAEDGKVIALTFTMDAQTAAWGGSLPEYASPYWWQLSIGPEIYGTDVKTLEVPWIGGANDTTKIGMAFNTTDSAGDHSYRGPVILEIEQHEYKEVGPNNVLDHVYTTFLKANFQAQLIGEHGEPLDISGSFSYSNVDC